MRAPARARRLAGASVALVSALLLLGGCGEAPKPEPADSAAPPERILARVGFEDLPGWRADDLGQALPALKRSCARLLTRPADAAVGPDAVAGTVADWRAPCRAIAQVEDGDTPALRRLLQDRFVPFAVESPDGPTGLFTGYYEASLKAAPTRHGAYQHPIYARPDDLVTVALARFGAGGQRLVGRVAGGRLVPYYTRGQIMDGALQGRDLALYWADDPVDVFFLHVQGSGVLQLPDGRRQRVGFAASNGRDFTAIGRELIRSGALDGQDMSMQAIRDWLRAHPDRADDLMRENARYIFFRRIDGPGPVGAQGVPLTAGRSLAVDPAYLPLGAPVFLDTSYPGSDAPLHRLMVAQDTGSAITGPVRGDVFWGSGADALAVAGRMKQPGRYYLLLPDSVAARRVSG